MTMYVTFLRDVACEKLLNSANVSRSYSQNNTGTVFLRHGVYPGNCDNDRQLEIAIWPPKSEILIFVEL